MRKLLAALAACLALPVFAEPAMIARDGDNWLRIYAQSPCKLTAHPVFQQGIPEGFHAAMARFGGQEFEACWLVRADAMVLVIYSDGDAGLVPIVLFKPDGA